MGKHVEEGYKLGRAVHDVRSHGVHVVRYSARRDTLERLGFEFDRGRRVEENGWQTFLQKLLTFKNRVGHCRVPVSHVEGHYKLGLKARAVRNEGRYISRDGGRCD